jgi:hypothetical protein
VKSVLFDETAKREKAKSANLTIAVGGDPVPEAK